MGSDAPALVEDLDAMGADADIDLVAGQGMGDAVEGVMDLDVVVDVDAGLAPLGETRSAGSAAASGRVGRAPRTNCCGYRRSSGTAVR